MPRYPIGHGTLVALSLVAAGWFASASRAAGPYLVKDIKPGPLGSSPTSMTEVGDRLFFNADDGVHGQELWVSDGTEEGTYMVIDLIPGSDGSVPQWWMADLNGQCIFEVDDNVNGLALYRSDGTALGTVRLGDVNEGGSSIPSGSCVFSFFPLAKAGNRSTQECLYQSTGTSRIAALFHRRNGGRVDAGA